MSSVPTGWAVRALGDVAQTALGKMLDRGKPRGHGLVPYLRNVNVQWDRIETHDLLTMELADDERVRFAVERGDLLVCEGGEIGRAAIWQGRADYIAYQKALHRVRPSDDVESRYLLHLFRHLALSGQLAKHATGTTISHLPQQQLRRLRIPVPPIEEQRRIVDILEDHLSRVDAGLRSVSMSEARLRTLRLSELRDARAYAVNAGAPLRSIGDIAQTDLGKMLDAKRAIGSATPYLRNVNVRWGSIDLSDVRTVPLTDSERQDFALRSGDLLICEGGEPGRCAVWNAPDQVFMTYQKALHRLRVKPELTILTEYIALMLEEFIRTGRAEPLFTGTTIKHLPQEKLRSITIPVPPLAAQHRTLTLLSDRFGAAARLNRDLASAREEAGSLRRALLKAAFSGQLIRHASDVDCLEERVAP
jgi:type I restriction enzyme S subunit